MSIRKLRAALVVCLSIAALSSCAAVLSAPAAGPVALTSHDLAGHVVCRGCADLDQGAPLHRLVAAALTAEPGAALELPDGFATALPGPPVQAAQIANGGGADRLPAWTPDRCQAFAPLFIAEADRHGLDPALLVAVAIAESGCQVAPLGPAGPVDSARGQSCKGNTSTAYGLMQVTTRWHGTASDWCDPAVAVPYAARKLAADARSRGSIDAAVYAYNSGNIRTSEGDRYLRWVGGMLRDRGAATSSAFLEWCRVRDQDGDGIGTFGLPCTG